MDNMIINSGDISVRLVSDSLQYEVIKNGYAWIGEGKAPQITFYRQQFSKYMPVKRKFSSASKITHRIDGMSIVSEYSGFRVLGQKISAKLIVTASIVGDGKVDFAIRAEESADYYIKAVCYPQPFNAVSYDASTSYSVEPLRQGVMIPDGHLDNVKGISGIVGRAREINAGEAYMAVYGRVCDGRGYSAVADESYDCSLLSSMGKGNSILTTSYWRSSLGRLGYDRIMHYAFYDDCDYIKVAKHFRHHEQSKGRLVSIDDKIKANPNVAKLIGTPIIHWRIMENNVPNSGIYKQTKVGETLHNTFPQTAEKFTKYHSLGLDKAYVHIDGWGKCGYDNQHPYILPPCPKAGGMDGMRELSKTCQSLDYMFGLHDQYRDYYLDSAVYDKAKCIRTINKYRPYYAYWAGGPHNYLCTKFASQFVERTYRELEENGIAVEGSYLDVFSAMGGDECFHADHKITRAQSIGYRGECFDLLRSKGMIMSSEEIGCQVMQYLDLVHHAPYAVTPQGGGVAVGIPIPLANLVYHDSVFVPWHIEGTGGWGIPDGDEGRLHCILNGQSPYFNNSMAGLAEESDEELRERIDKVLDTAKVNALVYNAEMISHEFVSDDRKVQKTTYSNGYAITVDFALGTYYVELNGKEI